MLANLDALEKGFSEIFKKSKEECPDEIEKIRKLTFIVHHFFYTIQYDNSIDKKTLLQKFGHSLVFMCILELIRNSGHVLFLTCSGLYRQSFNNIRYVLESIIPALYLDQRHPSTNISTKIEILKEVEDKREYHAVRLIDELKIGYKGILRKEYKKLSQLIHPSHKQILVTMRDISERGGIPTNINCEEITKIYDSMKIMYDIFIFLFLDYFPEVKESLIENLDFISHVKFYNLYLISKALKIQLS